MPNEQDLITMTPMEAREQYFKSKKEEIRDATIRSQSTPVKRFSTWCEVNNQSLNDLNGLDIQKFYDELKEEGYARTTLHNYMSAVRQFLLYLERIDVVPPDTADKVHRPTLESGDRVRETTIEPDRVNQIVRWLGKYQYASRDHILMLLLWHCGLRTGSLRAVDIGDFSSLDGAGPVLNLQHRPGQGTPLKNGVDGERPVNVNDDVAQAVRDYIEQNRIDSQDEFGRRPLLTSQHGRYSQDQIRKTCLQYTCPRTTGIGRCNCEEDRTKETAGQCTESVSPHVIRAAAITHWRREDVPVEIVSDRMDVSRDVIEEHYDKRSKEGKAVQRRKYIDSI